MYRYIKSLAVSSFLLGLFLLPANFNQVSAHGGGTRVGVGVGNRGFYAGGHSGWGDRGWDHHDGWNRNWDNHYNYYGYGPGYGGGYGVGYYDGYGPGYYGYSNYPVESNYYDTYPYSQYYGDGAGIYFNVR